MNTDDKFDDESPDEPVIEPLVVEDDYGKVTFTLSYEGGEGKAELVFDDTENYHRMAVSIPEDVLIQIGSRFSDPLRIHQETASGYHERISDALTQAKETDRAERPFVFVRDGGKGYNTAGMLHLSSCRIVVQGRGRDHYGDVIKHLDRCLDAIRLDTVTIRQRAAYRANRTRDTAVRTFALCGACKPIGVPSLLVRKKLHAIASINDPTESVLVAARAELDILRENIKAALLEAAQEHAAALTRERS
jgi:hypothetical protein